MQSQFETETRWYRQEGKAVITINGIVIRYLAYEQDDSDAVLPIFNGADVFTFVDGLIMTVSDYYCDPEAQDLIDIAAMAEKHHSSANIAPLGLSGRTSSQIRRQLSELSAAKTIFLNPSLSVTQLADHVGCSVMHLFHVLEEEKETTFVDFVNENRARFASSLLVETPHGEIDYAGIARQSGFDSTATFYKAFQTTFGDNPHDYASKFSKS